MKFEDIKKESGEFIADTYGRFDAAFEKGKGSLLYDFDGKEYIDFSSGIGVNVLGLADESWLKAVTEQAAMLPHVSNLFYSQPQTVLAKELCKRTGLSKAFFCNSGAEANEGAIKCARKYSEDKYGKERKTILTLKNSFHGRTIATLTATGQETFHRYFSPFLAGFKYAPANDKEALKKSLTDDVCAVMFELVQGEGGVIPLDKDFVLELSRLCLDKDILMICDEVQTGNGRTGTLYAYQQYGILPDIMTTAKGIGGGLPFGLIMFGEKTKGVFKPGDHATTFGGNPICAAGAVKILEKLDDCLLKEVSLKGELVRKCLKDAEGIKGVSGMGLMLGVIVERDSKEVVKECLKKGLVVLTAKEKVRLLPALNIPDGLLLKGLEILKDVAAGR